ncbi:substrate-binding domain-containing protein [Streptomyces sp. NPDC007164]|uniref:substrate-binding domain-containing protein n=1 Tax=Streptomyces sp. NPDC007164 TaxID=3156918 RepID=UPI0033EEADB0
MRPATVSRPTTAVAALVCALLALQPVTARAASYTKISGGGSTWSSNALDQWRRNVAANSGMTVNYSPVGSSVGREQFKNGTADFAVSEIPYGLTESGMRDAPPKRGYAYMPIVAGGTAFMYNLRIGGRKVTNLRTGLGDRRGAGHHGEVRGHPARCGPAHGLYRGDLTLQSCVGPDTGFTYLVRT